MVQGIHLMDTEQEVFCRTKCLESKRQEGQSFREPYHFLSAKTLLKPEMAEERERKERGTEAYLSVSDESVT